MGDTYLEYRRGGFFQVGIHNARVLCGNLELASDIV